MDNGGPPIPDTDFEPSDIFRTILLRNRDGLMNTNIARVPSGGISSPQLATLNSVLLFEVKLADWSPYKDAKTDCFLIPRSSVSTSSVCPPSLPAYDVVIEVLTEGSHSPRR